ncbi:MAG: sigma-70 family RNA polymerase sigma factor [bacterium]
MAAILTFVTLEVSGGLLYNCFSNFVVEPCVAPIDFLLKKRFVRNVVSCESPHDPGVYVTEPIETMEAIITEHEATLLRYASSLLRDPHAAQDVVQNVFIKLFSQWTPHSRPTEALRAWLFRVTHNEAIDAIRRRQRLHFLHLRQAQEQTPPSGASSPDDDRMEQVLAAVRKLDVPEQQVVLLRLQEGLSYQEIARITGRSEGNVGCILHHAVKKLGRLVQREPDMPGGGTQP